MGGASRTPSYSQRRQNRGDREEESKENRLEMRGTRDERGVEHTRHQQSNVQHRPGNIATLHPAFLRVNVPIYLDVMLILQCCILNKETGEIYGTLP